MPGVMMPGRVFAALYDRMTADVEREFGGPMRARLLASASGSVLEIGAGTGANVGHYPAGISRLVLTEPDRHMRIRLEERTSDLGRPAEIVGAGADGLPFGPGTFDAAVTTLVLCTVPDPAAALREVLRVLRPGGRLLFAEHVRSSKAGTARMQDAVRPLWYFAARGCHPNRDTLAAIEGAGFAVQELERTTMGKAPAIVREVIVGVARKPD